MASEVRIFLSSTFCDLQAERSVIVNKIAAALNERYNSRGLIINLVDLRWGVTEEASRNGKVIEICLREIRKSRPYFAAILGGRYGWCPGADEISRNRALFSEYPELKDDIEAGRSITEIEIQYAFLKNGDLESRAMFFLKDMDGMPSEMGETGEGMEHLMRLKETVLNKASEGLCSADSFTTPEMLGELFYGRVCELLDRDFPEDEPVGSVSRIFRMQNSNRRYEEFSAGLPGRNFADRLDTDLPTENIRFRFLLGHARDGLRHALACLSFRNIRASDRFGDPYPDEEDGTPVNYRFIPIDVDSCVNSAEKFLELFMYICGQENCDCPTAGHASYEDYVKAVRALSPSSPVVCIVRDLDDLPLEELRRLSFLGDIDEKIGFVIQCREASFLSTVAALGLNEEEYTETEFQPRLNVTQCLELVDSRLAEWSKELSPVQRMHLLLCPSVYDFRLLNMFLGIINRYGYYERLDEAIDRFIETRSDEEFIDAALEMYESEFNPEAVGWLFSRVAEDDAWLDEPELKAEFMQRFDISALEWASYDEMLENLADKISGRYLVRDTAVIDALAKRYGIRISVTDEKETPEEPESESAAAVSRCVRTPDEGAGASEESAYVRNMPLSIDGLVPYATVRIKTAEDRRNFCKDNKWRSYPSLVRRIGEASLLDGFIAALRESDSDDSLVTLLWVSLSGGAPEVTFEESLGLIADRLKVTGDSGLQTALSWTLYPFAQFISKDELFKDRVRVLELLYETFPAFDDMESKILSTIGGIRRRNINDIPDMNDICNFAIRWISDNVPGRFESFVLSFCANFSEENNFYESVNYTGFLEAFSGFYREHILSFPGAYQELLNVLERKLNGLDVFNRGHYGKLMLRLGYDVQPARTAVLETRLYSLGSCLPGTSKQKRFFYELKELYSLKDYTPPECIREREICNLLMSKRFDEAAAVSREGFGWTHISAFDYLEAVCRGDWGKAASFIEAAAVHLFVLRAPFYYEMNHALKVSTMLVLLAQEELDMDGFMGRFRAYEDSYFMDSDRPYSSSLLPLRKFIASIYMQRMSMYDDADEMFRQACMPADASEYEDADAYATDMDLINVMQCIRKGELPQYSPENLSVLESLTYVPGALAIVYLSEKAGRLRAEGGASYENTVRLLGNIKFSGLLDFLFDCCPGPCWR